MGLGTFITQEYQKVAKWFTDEEQALIDFMTPLMEQIKVVALQLGKDDLQAGLKVLEDAALSAVTAAASAPTDKVAAAETALLGTLNSEGVTAIHNAEAGALKAAVAILQSTTSPATTSVQ